MRRGAIRFDILVGLGATPWAGDVLAATPLSASLGVTVSGATSAGGRLRVGLYDEATFPSLVDFPLLTREAATSGDTVILFDRVPPGTYAVRAYQDVNADGRWEKGEPRGISNDAKPDDFDAAAITLVPGANRTSIRLH